MQETQKFPGSIVIDFLEDFGMNFETALSHAKNGEKIARIQFRDTCYIVAKYPDAGSQNTKPYLQMWKKRNADTEEVDAFPVDLSCESIFAEDWYIKN